MKLVSRLGGEENIVDVTKLDSGKYKVIIDGEEMIIDVPHINHDKINILYDNKSLDYSYLKSEDMYELNYMDKNFEIELYDERRFNLRKAEFSNSGPEKIKSSMPGKIVKLEVSEGDLVEAGQGILIMEAMKMENEVKCAKAGIIKKIYVKEGDAVEKSTVLVEIESE
ncbi:MAG: biotin/lipoyl-binding protein [Melioribacteraceae bacterium]|nr:biotin/lipoyl-binding protein [Melioribacteraceae bacterium]